MDFKDRIYLDHNATTPVAPSVLSSLSQLPFANPSSVHGSGKKAKREVNLVGEFLFELFRFDDRVYEIFFHSGATEGINSIVKGMALEAKRKNKNFTFFYLGSDHSCKCADAVRPGLARKEAGKCS